MFAIPTPLIGLSMLLVSSSSATGSAPATQPAEAPPRLSVRGTDILAPDGEPIRLRGFNLLWWVPPTAQDVADIRELGANCVRYQFGYIPSGRFNPRQLRFLKRHVRLFTSQGLWVIPNVHTFHGHAEAAGQTLWNTPELQREFLDMWDHVLEQLKDEPYIAAWEPLNEPFNVEREKLAPWYREVVAHFRRIDTRTPIVVEGANYSGAEELLDYLKLDDPNVIYAFHFYHPHEYTHMRPPEGKPLLQYPGKRGKVGLALRMSSAVQFRDRHQVPVFCGEWGVCTGAPGYRQWLEDVGELLETHQFPWTHWAWAMQAHMPLNETFDLNKHKKDIYDTVAAIMKRALAADRNQAARPTGTRPSGKLQQPKD